MDVRVGIYVELLSRRQATEGATQVEWKEIKKEKDRKKKSRYRSQKC